MCVVRVFRPIVETAASRTAGPRDRTTPDQKKERAAIALMMFYYQCYVVLVVLRYIKSVNLS